LGGTVYNVNEPSLDYPTLGRDCGSLDDAIARNNCATARDVFPNRIGNNETHTMERQIELEAGVFSPDRVWSLSGTYDLSGTPDVLGDEQQWFSVTGAFSGRGWWVPGLRLGYKVNRAGSELSYYTGGISLFRVINIDAAVSEQTVSADGEEAPRAARVSLGLELFF
jgi:hypothetical protein